MAKTVTKSQKQLDKKAAKSKAVAEAPAAAVPEAPPIEKKAKKAKASVSKSAPSETPPPAPEPVVEAEVAVVPVVAPEKKEPVSAPLVPGKLTLASYHSLLVMANGLRQTVSASLKESCGPLIESKPEVSDLWQKCLKGLIEFNERLADICLEEHGAIPIPAGWHRALTAEEKDGNV